MAAERAHGLERSRTIMSVREQLRQYLFETLIPAKQGAWPADDADLFDAGLDSLRLMQLLVFVEKEIKITLPDHEVSPDRIESVNALVEWIESHR